MDERAALPPGLPSPAPTLSYWQNPPSALAQHRTTLDLPQRIDIAIVGSGITGASLAYQFLSKPDPPSVLLLEARTACSGATGRNGGHTKHAAYHGFLDYLESLGADEAARIVRFKAQCMRAVHAFARQHDIQCDSWQGNTVDIYYDEGQFMKARKAISEIRRVLGDDDDAAQYQIWHADEVRKSFLVEGALGAVSYEAGSLWPYKFVNGVLELAISKGLNLQTETPVLSLHSADRGWELQTSRGTVTAQKVLLATNGYTAHLCPQLQGIIVPLRGHMTAQRPGSKLPKEGLSSTYSFIYHDGYEYMINRPSGANFAGDVMIGGGSTKAPNYGINEFGTTDDTTIDPIILRYLENSAAMRFGSRWGEDDREGRLRNAWTGIMGYSADGFPLVGEVPGNNGLYVCASFQGSGMVLCFESARALVDIMQQNDTEKVDEWFPKSFHITPERLRVKFRGRLHTKVTPKDLELKSQDRG